MIQGSAACSRAGTKGSGASAGGMEAVGMGLVRVHDHCTIELVLGRSLEQKRTAAEVKSSQPLPLWELATCARTVSALLSSSTPWSAHCTPQHLVQWPYACCGCAADGHTASTKLLEPGSTQRAQRLAQRLQHSTGP